MLILLLDTVLFSVTGRMFDSILKVISKILIIPIVNKICPLVGRPSKIVKGFGGLKKFPQTRPS